jgi:hypothetical protein
MKFFMQCVCPIALMAVAIGCGPGGPATVPVSGKITIGGQPANNVSISFIPETAGAPTASGTATNGTYTLYTGADGKPGAVVGKYKITLAAQAGSDEAAYRAGKAPGTAELPFPADYTDPAKTPLTKEVTAGGGAIDLEIPGPGGAGG